MNISEIEKSYNYYENEVKNLAVKLEVARERNAQLENLKREKVELTSFLNEIQEYWENLALVRASVIKESDDYQTRRIEYLNELITKALRDIFPTENYTAKITYDYKRRDIVKLRLVDQEGHVSTPDIGQGQLMQYVISFAAVSGITKGLGFKNIFIDEAFGVAAVDKLPELGNIIDSNVKAGMQVILISQNPELYNSIPRRVISLEKDALTKTTGVVDITDY